MIMEGTISQIFYLGPSFLRIGPATKSGHRVPLVPSKRPFRERMPDQRYGRTLGKRTVVAVAIDAGPQEGAATEESVTVRNGLYLPGRIGGNGVSFLVDTGSGVSILAARTWRKWGRAEDGLTRYWGRLYSVEGRGLECLGKARLTVTLGTRVIEWSFIVAEIGDDEGILGNDFAMAHELTVRPCEGAVYLPDLAGTGKGHMGERLRCTIRAVTEVRAVTEETLAVRAMGSATLAPHTVSQVRVIVPTPRARGTVMIDPGPGPLGHCPVPGIVEVEQDSSIWLAYTGSQEKGSERTWIGSGSYARGALAQRGERAGTPAPPPGRRIRPEETAPITLYYAHRPPSPGRRLNTHGDKARAGLRGNTW